MLVRKIFLNIVWEFQSLPSQQRVCATAKLQQRHIKPSSASENKPNEYRRRMAPDTFESRMFEEQGETLTICPQHRDILGTLWNSSRPPTKCSHPLHGASNAKPDRGISAAFSKAILDHWGLFIPTGSGKYFALISLL